MKKLNFISAAILLTASFNAFAINGNPNCNNVPIFNVLSGCPAGYYTAKSDTYDGIAAILYCAEKWWNAILAALS